MTPVIEAEGTNSEEEEEKYPTDAVAEFIPSAKRGKHSKMTSKVGTLEMQKEPIAAQHKQIVSLVRDYDACSSDSNMVSLKKPQKGCQTVTTMKEMDNANQQFLKAIQTMQTMKLLIKSKQQEIELMNQNVHVGMKRSFGTMSGENQSLMPVQ